MAHLCIVESALELEQLVLRVSIWHTMATLHRTPEKGEVDGVTQQGLRVAAVLVLPNRCNAHLKTSASPCCCSEG
jgi:hypothetical protein